jgi:2-keto-4-pentenoate hydratase
MTDVSGELATLLANARRNGTTIALRQEVTPQTREVAYATYSRTVRALDDRVIGWKANVGADGKALGAPMLASGLLSSGGEWRRRWQRTAIEIEVAFRLRKDLPPRPGKPYSRSEILDACGSLVCGLEIVESRIALDAGAVLPPLLGLADCLSNAGYVLGSELADVRSLDLSALRCRFWADDELLHDGPCKHPAGDALKPLQAWADDQADQLGGLKAGQVVTTGTLTAPLHLGRPALVRGEIEGIGDVAVSIF